ncbi:hypothetical protein RchiOBHm_Chr6g0263501 [Rosa chinensis]|uniref:Uncharacterized protein n=1 Tax=Rosa chinensis TaxID=74649 RepID=A0A2P6PNY4_ROSCH|nr:hypothetical protein RchiOBHm_Chr6g0263501 [Rosa chinensis]
MSSRSFFQRHDTPFFHFPFLVVSESCMIHFPLLNRVSWLEQENFISSFLLICVALCVSSSHHLTFASSSFLS